MGSGTAETEERAGSLSVPVEAVWRALENNGFGADPSRNRGGREAWSVKLGEKRPFFSAFHDGQAGEGGQGEKRGVEMWYNVERESELGAYSHNTHIATRT